MKFLFVFLTALLTGCAMLEGDAGKAHYSMEPVLGPNGQMVCCKVDIKNAKNIGEIKAQATKLDDGSYEIVLEEKGVDASGPIGVMMEQQQAQTELLRQLIPLLPASPRVP